MSYEFGFDYFILVSLMITQLKLLMQIKSAHTIGGADIGFYGLHHSDSANSIHLFLKMEFNIDLIKE